MQAPTQITAKHLWLPLLMIFVLCVSITNPVLLAETQLQEIELKAGGERSSSEDGHEITGFPVASLADHFLSVSPFYPDSLSPGIGSDAYPSNITHGPPVRVFPV